MSEFRADLHCHTTCSDGSLSPIEILHLAKQNKLSALSITDHDTIEAYSQALPAALELGIELLTGVEFSAAHQNSSIHILGYGYQLENLAIQDFCKRHTERRLNRNRGILDLLHKIGMPISEEELQSTSSSSSHQKGTIGRPHIAMIMVKKGYITTPQEAFKKYIGEGRPCFVQGQTFTIEETIDVIHQAKGLAVIAHPHLIKQSHLLDILFAMNFDGIECYYGNFPAQDHKRWLKIAKKKNWLVTGGSDFHGSIKPNLNLGSSWIGKNEFQTLKEKIT